MFFALCPFIPAPCPLLLSISEPTEGRVELRGRVASLLEVGTGFRPELTGRVNIFLNGMILAHEED